MLGAGEAAAARAVSGRAALAGGRSAPHAASSARPAPATPLATREWHSGSHEAASTPPGTWPLQPPRGCRGHSRNARAPASSASGAGAAGASTAAAAPASGPQPLWAAVLATYDRAQARGAAFRTETSTSIVVDESLAQQPGGARVPFIVRVVAALRAKPKGPMGRSDRSNSGGGGEPKAPAAAGAAAAASPAAAASESPTPRPAFVNPFLPYECELFCAHLPLAAAAVGASAAASPSHVLLLNKFNVVAYHVLVVTSEFKRQTDPLDASDFEATRDLLEAMPGPAGGLAFYNCGAASGRSQPHKHVQVVPLPLDGTAGEEGRADGGPPMERVFLAATASAAPFQPCASPALPFRHVVCSLAWPPRPAELEAAYRALLAACDLRWPPAYADPTQAAQRDPTDEAGAPSYNLLLTRRWMAVVPRAAERAGPVAVNALGFAGTLLVRSEDERAYVVQRGPMAILRDVGLPT